MAADGPNDFFVPGDIVSSFIENRIQEHRNKLGIGAHSIFLGQVRADELGGRTVRAIAYSAYVEMALEKMKEIKRDIFRKFDLTCLEVYHSLGEVTVGGISLFVFASTARRNSATVACAETVERIKAELPVWGKELLDDGTAEWKTNG